MRSVISFRISEEPEKKMERNCSVNGSEIVRRAIAERLEFEERSKSDRAIDSSRLSSAVRSMKSLREKTTCSGQARRRSVSGAIKEANCNRYVCCNKVVQS